MKVHHLPHYTAERFYLLSELEQKVQFVFLNELLSDDDDVDDNIDTVSQVNVPADDHDVLELHGRVGGHDNNIIIGADEDDVSILYFSWKAKEHDRRWVATDSSVTVTETVRDKLSGVVRRIKPGHRCLIIIDWLIADKNLFDSAVVEISELLSWFRGVYTEEEGAHRSIITIIVGVSDSIRGVPGLEKCNELVDTLIRSYPELREGKKSAMLVKVYGIDRDEFVGY